MSCNANFNEKRLHNICVGNIKLWQDFITFESVNQWNGIKVLSIVKIFFYALMKAKFKYFSQSFYVDLPSP